MKMHMTIINVNQDSVYAQNISIYDLWKEKYHRQHSMRFMIQNLCSRSIHLDGSDVHCERQYQFDV